MNHLPFSLGTCDDQQVAYFSTQLEMGYNKKIALIVQGGGQRGIFTAGVLDSFLENQFDPFELYIGTSAGALNLSSYISRQYKFGYNFIFNFTTNDSFFNLYKYLGQQKSMNLDAALQDVSPTGSNPLNFEVAKKTLKHRVALACATRKDTLQDIYLPMYREDWREVLLASCAIPLLYNKPVNMNDLEWVDGGVSAAVPVKEAWRRGAELVIVIRTEPIEQTKIKEDDERRIFDDWRTSIESYLPSYIDKLKKNSSSGFIKNLQRDVSHILEQWREPKESENEDEISVPILDEIINDPNPEAVIKAKSVRKKQWLRSLNVELILQLTRHKNKQEVQEMLAKYFRTYQDVNDFLINPPEGLQVIQLAPEKRLHSRALLSSEEDLKKDYLEGKILGDIFIKSFADSLNKTSSLMQYLRT